jgi:hypothetical protein
MVATAVSKVRVQVTFRGYLIVVAAPTETR